MTLASAIDRKVGSVPAAGLDALLLAASAVNLTLQTKGAVKAALQAAQLPCERRGFAGLES